MLPANRTGCRRLGILLALFAFPRSSQARDLETPILAELNRADGRAACTHLMGDSLESVIFERNGSLRRVKFAVDPFQPIGPPAKPFSQGNSGLTIVKTNRRSERKV